MKGALKRIITLLLVLVFYAPHGVLIGCASSAPSDNGGDVSETNVQEQGVDEADIVKINAKGEIYKAQRDGVTVSVMNKADGTLNVIKKKATQNVTPLEMFLYGDDYLIVINAKVNVGNIFYDENKVYSFNYDTMQVNVYDLKASIGDSLVLLRSDEFRGTYKTSRLIDGKMFLISNFNGNYGEAYVDYFDGAVDFNLIYKDDNNNIYGGFLIAKLDLGEVQARYQTTLYADRNAYDIYCSKYALYIMKGGWFYNYHGWGCGRVKYLTDGYYYGGQITESIDRISLDTLERTGTASGFNGISPNRFCLYDNGEYLFVANQRVYRSDKEDLRGIGNYLYTFDQNMNEASVLGPLAVGETMYSARFDGEIAYIVTAEQSITFVDPITFEPRQIFVDPLFKIDISNPLEPVVLGELKIEGFSTYMQSFGDGLLLGLGRGSDGTELKLSLFDTANDDPTEVNSYLMAFGASEAENEARAILCEADRNIFAFAVRFDEGDITRYGTAIFGLEDGLLSQRAFLPEIYENMDYSRKRTRRVVRIGDYLLAVSDGYIASYLLSDVLNNGILEPTDIADTRILVNDAFYTVKFGSNIGVNYPDREVEQGYFVTLPKPLDIADEWQFGYWTEYPDTIQRFNHNQSISRSMILYARWHKLPWRTVKFDLNLPDGMKTYTEKTLYISSPSSQTVEDNAKLNTNMLLIGRLIPNYKLTHWYQTDPSVAFNLNAPINDSFTLNAYWKKVVTHKVTFDYNYPDRGYNNSNSTLVEGGMRAVRPNIDTDYYVYKGGNGSKTQYVLEYWYKGLNKNTPYDFNLAVNSNMTLTAKWKKV